MTPDAERMTEISDRLLDYQPAKKPWRVHYLEDVPWLLERLAAVRNEATRAEREECAKLGADRAEDFGKKHSACVSRGIESHEGAWWRARKVEASDYAAAIRDQASG